MLVDLKTVKAETFSAVRRFYSCFEAYVKKGFWVEQGHINSGQIITLEEDKDEISDLWLIYTGKSQFGLSV